MPRFDNVDEFSFDGDMETHGHFKIHEKFPNAKIVWLWGRISPGDQQILSECTRIEVLGTPDEFNETEVKKIIAKNDLHHIRLAKTVDPEIIEKLSMKKKLKILGLGRIGLSLFAHDTKISPPFHLPSVEVLHIHLERSTKHGEYRPAYECENIKTLHVLMDEWNQKSFGEVIDHHTMHNDEHGYLVPKPHKIEYISTNPKHNEHWQEIIELVTNVEVIGLRNVGYSAEISLKYCLVDMFKNCPTDTKLNKVILYKIPKDKCDYLETKKAEFLKPQWGFHVGHVAFVDNTADVTIARNV